MKTDQYITNKLLENQDIKHFLSYMKDKGGCYVAGGALTSIATGKHDQIEDYDVYFPDVKAAVEGIRYMKEHDPHVAFVSDKSITYVLNSVTKVQFIYYDFYPTASDIFDHFDFSVCCAAYDARTEDLVVHENFWMHNSQRFLSVNTGTKFPLLSLLRLDKYKSRGYKTSRNEVLKLGLAVAQLNIDSWDKFKEQIGNTYGFTLADLSDLDKEEFSIEKGIDRIQRVTDDPDNVPMQNAFLYPHDTMDFLLLGEPIKTVKIKDDWVFANDYAANCSCGLEDLIKRGLLEKEEVELKDLIKDVNYYSYAEEGSSKVGEEVNASWGRNEVATLQGLHNFPSSNKVIVRVSFDECDVKDVADQGFSVSKYKIEEVICRASDLQKLKNGDEVTYAPRVKRMHNSGSVTLEGWAFKEKSEFLQGEISQMRKLRGDHLKKHVVVIDGGVGYAHHTYKGFILEGGEDITANELLHYLDSFNLCFGGYITLESSGTFSAKVHTD